jgi:Zn finger protein HypA/HybF involved in hydrogenase expression
MTITEIMKGQEKLITSSIEKMESPTIFCFHCGNEIKESDIDKDLNCPICRNSAYKLDENFNIVKNVDEEDNPEY